MPTTDSTTASKSDQVRSLLSTGMSAADIAKQVGCTVGLVYNIKSMTGQAKKRDPGRPRKASAEAGVAGLDGILAAVRDAEQERTNMRAALERIRAVVADALG